MVRALALGVMLAVASVAQAGQIRGFYLETRTCQVYTGPCFANSEMGLTGRDAIMAWHIDQGSLAGVDLSGLNVVLVLRATDTLGHQGIDGAGEVRSVLLLDERADAQQREALASFVKQYAGRAAERIVEVRVVPIQMSLDQSNLVGTLVAGREVKLATRKARATDCICSNEVAFYPPLAPVHQFAAGITTEGEFRGTGLGARWSTPESRSAYVGIFRYGS
ncbi:MAG: hypothetical protein KatS3mg110_0820 [Pirellulaceae bacterium]|nr:MAG: hypothetical protein KatS3mg110_0820 [Pirellulaceae bacterium]